MSVIGDPIPQLVEVPLPFGMREMIEGLSDELPVFKEGAKKAGSMIAQLDAGRVLFDKFGLSSDPDINQFMIQLSTSRFVNGIYWHGRGRLMSRLNPFIPRLPQWLEKAVRNNMGGVDEVVSNKDINRISDLWVEYGNNHGRRLKSKRDWVEEVFEFDFADTPSEDERLNAIDNVTGNAKIYVDGTNMLNWQNVENFLNLLRNDNLHPHQGKINRAAQKIVFYYHKPISDVKKLFVDAKETNVVLRGPAQDFIPIFILADGRWKIYRDEVESNDGSLRNHARGGDFHYKPRGYNQTDFFRAYIDMVSYYSKNPAIPYMLAAIDIRYTNEQTDKSKKTIDWLKDTIKSRSGLDSRIRQTWREPYNEQ